MKNSGFVWKAVAAAAAAGIMAAAASGCGSPAAEVPVAVLKRQTVERTASCSGTVQAGESRVVSIPSVGVVSEVTVRAGQKVQAGMTVARLDKEATRAAVGDGERAQMAMALSTMEETVVAPCDGVVMEIAAQVGSLLHPGEPCIVLAPFSTMQVQVAIREKDLKDLKTGQKAYVSGEAFDRELYEGTLTEISSVAKTLPVTGETVVEGVVSLSPEGVDDSLRLGLTAKARIVTETVEGGLVMPYEAVLADDQGKEYVYVADDGAARRRYLSVGDELTSGLLLADQSLAGAAVILRPDRVAADGAAVSVRKEQS